MLPVTFHKIGLMHKADLSQSFAVLARGRTSSWVWLLEQSRSNWETCKWNCPMDQLTIRQTRLINGRKVIGGIDSVNCQVCLPGHESALQWIVACWTHGPADRAFECWPLWGRSRWTFRSPVTNVMQLNATSESRRVVNLLKNKSQTCCEPSW